MHKNTIISVVILSPNEYLHKKRPYMPYNQLISNGAGNENRTRTNSLEGCSSTIKLYLQMVGKTGFEPATSWSQTKRSTKLSYFPNANKLYTLQTKMSSKFVCKFKFLMARTRGVEPLAF